MLVRERSLVEYVEPDHRDRNSGLEDDASGLRIDIDVEFSGRRDIAAGKRASHHGRCLSTSRAKSGSEFSAIAILVKGPNRDKRDLTWAISGRSWRMQFEPLALELA